MTLTPSRRVLSVKFPLFLSLFFFTMHRTGCRFVLIAHSSLYIFPVRWLHKYPIFKDHALEGVSNTGSMGIFYFKSKSRQPNFRRYFHHENSIITLHFNYQPDVRGKN